MPGGVLWCPQPTPPPATKLEWKVRPFLHVNALSWSQPDQKCILWVMLETSESRGKCTVKERTWCGVSGAASNFFCLYRTLLTAKQVSHQLPACLHSPVASLGSPLLNSPKPTKFYLVRTLQFRQVTLQASLSPSPRQGHPHIVLTYHWAPEVCTALWRVREQMLQALQGMHLRSSHESCHAVWVLPGAICK